MLQESWLLKEPEKVYMTEDQHKILQPVDWELPSSHQESREIQGIQNLVDLEYHKSRRKCEHR